MLGGLFQVGLTVFGMGLLMASPIIAHVMLVGSGAFLGVLASLSYLAPKPPTVTQAEIAAGGRVLLANTLNAEETAMARDVLTASSGVCNDVDMIQSGRDSLLS